MLNSSEGSYLMEETPPKGRRWPIVLSQCPTTGRDAYCCCQRHLRDFRRTGQMKMIPGPNFPSGFRVSEVSHERPWYTFLHSLSFIYGRSPRLHLGAQRTPIPGSSGCLPNSTSQSLVTCGRKTSFLSETSWGEAAEGSGVTS